MVVAFRRPESPYVGYGAALHEIDPKADYEVTAYHSYDSEKPIVMNGEMLRELKIEIDDRPGSVIIEYRKIAR
jgi:hypothetical protein